MILDILGVYGLLFLWIIISSVVKGPRSIRGFLCVTEHGEMVSHEVKTNIRYTSVWKI